MNIYLLLTTITLFAFHYMSYATDTMSMAQVLKEGETLISYGGSFELGFFSPGNSTNRYVGIWYKKVTVMTVVWVANRETPLTNRSGSLKLIEQGVLVLEDEANVVVWSTNTSHTVTNPVVQLLDSGNLVVKDGNDNNSTNFLWQSFSHPTDTLLPTMKLGWNFVTHVDLYLSSWKSNDDPARGDFTLHCDPTGYPQMIFSKGGEEKSRCGPWDGLSFSGSPNLRKNPIYEYRLILNKNELYYQYDLLNSSVISRLTLNTGGVAQRWTWIDRTQGWSLYLTQPTDSCDSYKLCGAYGTCDIGNSPNCGCLSRFVPRDQGGWDKADWSDGCIRRKALDCSNGDGFLMYSDIKLPDTRNSWFNDSMNIKECRVLCSLNCSCMAYASLDIRNGGSGCLIWYGELIDIRELSGGQEIYIRMASSEIVVTSVNTDGKKREILIVCLSLVMGLFLLGLVLMLYSWRRKKINSHLRETGTLREGYVNKHSDERCDNDLELPMFDLDTIAKATDNFSIDNKLGEGGFGPVYKGVVGEEQEIAVKRLSRTSFQGIDEFKNEVICIAKLQHRNLVKLLGCCIEGEESILVYEYLTNKSLDLILFDPVKSTLLDWHKRFQIINGTSSSDWSKVRDERNQIGGLAESLLSAISEIIKSVLCLQLEREAFTEISCYLYRATMVIMELRINWNTATSTTESLQSLSTKVDSAKSFIAEVERTAHKVQPYEIGNIVQQLESVIRSIGENLSMMSSSAFGNQEYIQEAARALSKEMKDVSFTISKSHQYSEMEIRKGKETDLYAVDVDVSAMSLQLSDYSQTYVPERQETSKAMDIKNDSKRTSCGSSLMALPQLAQYMEPLYDTFFCPLTKRIMDDPVTVESGVTYERKAITEFFDKIQDPKAIVCPESGLKLKSVNLSTNMALKATIDEWKERNEAARIKVARAALSLGSTENMVLEAIDDLRRVCEGKPYNKVQVRAIGIIPLLANLVGYQSRNVRCATLELLRQLADDQDGQDMIARTVDISTLIKMLSSGHIPSRHASALLLLELTRTQFFHGKIGAVAGGILMLITVKYRQSDTFTSEMANKILKNLERLPDNIKLMAENGYWEPLLTNLVEGGEEMRIEMANYLGEIVPGPNSKIYVEERATPALIEMVQTGTSLTRTAAFKALKQISGSHPNAKILIEAGIMQIMIEEIFRRTIQNEPIHSKTEAAAILANILETGVELENFQVNTHGHTISSDYIVYNIIGTIKNSTPDDLNINLIRVLLCLIKVPRASGTVISVLKETDASYSLIELINTPNEELGIASIKLLTTLSAFMGHTLSDRLCKTRGQPENLIQNLSDITRVTEKDAVSAIFLARLPHQNLTLNLALVNRNIVPIVMKHINQIQRSGTRSSRHASAYFEGLVGILCRMTTTLYDHQILLAARTYNFTSVLTDLLTRSFTDEVQKFSAVGLENLSKQSIVLSRPPRWKKTKILRFFFFKKCISINLSKDKNSSLCPIHGGVCSSQETFCLLDAEAVERLLACMDHENVEVIQAALSALSTLLDDNVNVEKSLNLLGEMDAVQHVLNALKEHKEETLWQRAFWVIEKFLTKGRDESFSNISQDRLLPGTLVSAFHHGDDCTREMAEKILRHLNRMPTISHTMTFTT